MEEQKKKRNFRIGIFSLGFLVFLIGILRTVRDEGIFLSMFLTGIAIMVLSWEKK